MTDIVTPPLIQSMPPAPVLTDTQAVFNAKAFATVGALPAFISETNAVASATYANSVVSEESAISAQSNADEAKSARDAAAISAISAVNAPGTSGTTGAALVVGAGVKTFSTAMGKAWVVGQAVLLAHTGDPVLVRMFGVVGSYDQASGAMVVHVPVDAFAGSGTYAGWTISLTATREGLAWSRDVEQLEEDLWEARQVVTLQDFGAVGDGVANDTAAWNAMAASTKLRVVMPGSYLVNGRVRQYSEAVVFSGDEHLSRSDVYRSVSETTSFLAAEATDYRGDTFPNYFRRVIEYRRPVGSTGGDGAIYDVVAEKGANSTALGFNLRFFALACEKLPEQFGDEYAPYISRIGRMLMAFQQLDSRRAQFGGFLPGANNGTASCAGTAHCALGLLAAYRVTRDPLYLQACKRAATFLQTLHNPNPVFQTLYGVTPIGTQPAGKPFLGFCDEITGSDTITVTHTTWNVVACRFLKELYDVTGVAAYRTLYETTRDWGATGVTGMWDFYVPQYPASGGAPVLPARVSVSNSLGGLTVDPYDAAWHRRGEQTLVSGLVVNTVGTDQMELGIQALHETGYSIAALRTLYEKLIAFPHADAIRLSTYAKVVGEDRMQVAYAQRHGYTAANIGQPIAISVLDGGWTSGTYVIASIESTTTFRVTIAGGVGAVSGRCRIPPGPFGIAFDARICFSVYYRINAPYLTGAGVVSDPPNSIHFGAQYDIHGVGLLMRFKREQYPEHFRITLPVALSGQDYSTLLDENFNTAWSLDPTGLFEYATIGIGTVKGSIATGLLESYDA